ncbi:MAG: PAS domain S-box protein [Spirochaetes bacterium]|nr:PAS domain S-box protein [Spirochaetota bacterium]
MADKKRHTDKAAGSSGRRSRAAGRHRKSVADECGALDSFRSLIEIMPISAVILDLEGTIRLANIYLAGMHGYDSPDDIIGMKSYDLIAPEDWNRITDAVPKIMQSGHIWGERTLLRKDGTRFPADMHVSLLRNPAGEPCGFLTTAYDVSERKRAAEALSESEDRYRSIINSIPIGLHLYQLEPDGRLVFQGANPAADRILGVDNSSFIGKTIEEAFPGLIETEAPRRYRETAEKGTPWNIEQIDYLENSIRGVFEVNTFQIGHNHMAAAFSDISERKKSEQALLESEELYRLITEMSTDYLFRITLCHDGSMKVEYISENLTALTGRTMDEVLTSDMWSGIIYPDDREAFFSFQKYLIATGEPGELECRSFVKDGTMRWIRILARPILDPGTRVVVSIIGAIKDITERKEAEERIRASLAEKETLLKEIHHRVKNNLQIITSLLGLQARYQNDEHLTRQFEEAQHRIRSMALVHEKLYQSEDFGRINLESYIARLAEEVMAGSSVAERIHIRLDIDDYFISIEQAIPCGLIVNELLTNAIKYAFPVEWRGTPEIAITFRRREGNAAELVVSDNGIGVPAGIELGQTESLGLSLVSILAQQLRGAAKMDRTNGSTFTVAFTLASEDGSKQKGL